MVLSSQVSKTIKPIIKGVKLLNLLRFKKMPIEDIAETFKAMSPEDKKNCLIVNPNEVDRFYMAHLSKKDKVLTIYAPEIIYDGTMLGYEWIVSVDRIVTTDLTGITFVDDITELNGHKGFGSFTYKLDTETYFPNVNRISFTFNNGQERKRNEKLPFDRTIDLSNIVLNPYNFINNEQSHIGFQLAGHLMDENSRFKKLILPKNVYLQKDCLIKGGSKTYKSYQFFLNGFDTDGVEEIVIPDEEAWRKRSAEIEEETGTKNMLFDIIDMIRNNKENLHNWRFSNNFNEKKMSQDEILAAYIFHMGVQEKKKRYRFVESERERSTPVLV